MPTGTVKGFSHAKGFGFIVPSDGGKPLFFNRFDVTGNGIDLRPDGQLVQYDLMTDKLGKIIAVNVLLF